MDINYQGLKVVHYYHQLWKKHSTITSFFLFITHVLNKLCYQKCQPVLWHDTLVHQKKEHKSLKPAKLGCYHISETSQVVYQHHRSWFRFKITTVYLRCFFQRNLITIMSFQTCLALFLLWHINGDVLNNVQTRIIILNSNYKIILLVSVTLLLKINIKL